MQEIPPPPPQSLTAGIQPRPHSPGSCSNGLKSFFRPPKCLFGSLKSLFCIRHFMRIFAATYFLMDTAGCPDGNREARISKFPWPGIIGYFAIYPCFHAGRSIASLRKHPQGECGHSFTFLLTSLWKKRKPLKPPC